MDIEKVVALVILTNIGWFLVGWSIGFKEGVKDGFNRGRAAGLRAAFDRATEIVKNS
jgi:hypothetical protein